MTEGYLVAVDAPLAQSLTYLPPLSGEAVERGQSVVVPLGKRKAHGVVIKRAESTSAEFKLKAIESLSDQRPKIPDSYMNWLEWMSQYYIYPLGQIVESVFPPLKKTGRGPRKAPIVQEHEKSTPPPLTQEQQKVLKDISALTGFDVHLLHGVTGSGKTEVYLHLIAEALNKGHQCLVLVPEIALTPQLIDRFSRRFPNEVAVLHSHLTEREKTNQWWSMVDEQRRILIGARSALFCPLDKLGMIILDEEHEPSYKQDEKLKYHARDAAIMLAKNLNIPIVLGSATPSLESWNHALNGKYQLHTMSERVNARELPTIEVVDLRAEHVKRKDEPSHLPHWLSDLLYEELTSVFDKGEQAALFLNRRGIAQTAQCRACGFVAECPNCSVSLTVHARSHLICHYCDYHDRIKEVCPDCHESHLETLGLGTEKIEEDMRRLFPTLRIARADRDEIQSREQLEALISGMEQREIDLLVGTQMIAKGLDFPHLNLVGLVLADIGFHWPDFRASERSFQLLTQVSGRSGRQTAGRVVIQTYDPQHVSIVHTLKHDFKSFAEAELQERQTLFYPPFGRMAIFRIQADSQSAAENLGALVVHRAKTLQQRFSNYEKLLVLGPAPAPLAKLRGQFRYQVLVKADSAARLNAFCRQLLGPMDWIPPKTKVQVDIDPSQMM